MGGDRRDGTNSIIHIRRVLADRLRNASASTEEERGSERNKTHGPSERISDVSLVNSQKWWIWTLARLACRALTRQRRAGHRATEHFLAKKWI
eukprot:4426039-Pleurochrysis_carterae.AAC.1